MQFNIHLITEKNWCNALILCVWLLTKWRHNTEKLLGCTKKKKNNLCRNIKLYVYLQQLTVVTLTRALNAFQFIVKQPWEMWSLVTDIYATIVWACIPCVFFLMTTERHVRRKKHTGGYCRKEYSRCLCTSILVLWKPEAFSCRACSDLFFTKIVLHIVGLLL